MKKKTNVQLVKNLMEVSQYGVLAQAFVIEAIAKEAKRVSELSPEDFPENSFISPKAWIGVATEIRGKIAVC